MRDGPGQLTATTNMDTSMDTPSRAGLFATRGRVLLARFLLLAGGCVVGLLLGEVALRVFGYRLGTTSAYQPDPYCGVRHVPHYRGWHTRESRVWIEINSHGFRDRERTIAKPPGTYRIAVVGDSFSEALQVDLDDTFWSVMERSLAKSWQAAGCRVEVLNFGVSGYGTAQALEMLRHYVWDYQPDLVMLEFLAANDVSNNSQQLQQDRIRPYYTWDGERLVLDNSFLQEPERVRFQTSRWIRLKDAVVHHSRVAALIYQWRHRQHVPPPTTDGDEPGLVMDAFRAPDDPAWSEAWAVTDRLVVEMARQVRARGAEFVVLMANCGVEVDPQDTAREQLMQRLGVSDLLYPERRMAALGAAHDIPVICLAEAMRAYSQEHQVYLHGFINNGLGTGHWNETGHQVVGELAAAHLTRLWSDGPPRMRGTGASPAEDAPSARLPRLEHSSATRAAYHGGKPDSSRSRTDRAPSAT